MMTGLDTIAQLVRRYAVIEALYLQDVHNQASLGLRTEVLKLYGAVLEYQARVVCHMNSGTTLQTMKHITGLVAWLDQMDYHQRC